jgi:hypothetical protein
LKKIGGTKKTKKGKLLKPKLLLTSQSSARQAPAATGKMAAA